MACVQIDECGAVESRAIRARRAGFVAALAFSALMGLALMFVLVTPQRVGMVRTPELAGMLGLLVLPLVTAWAVGRTRVRGGTRGNGSGARLVRQAGARTKLVGDSPKASAPHVSATREATPSDWQVVIPVEMYQQRALSARATGTIPRAEHATARQRTPRGRATSSRNVVNSQARVTNVHRQVSRSTQAA